MAIGDAVSSIASVGAGAFLDMQPAVGVEWIIHNCGSEGPAELYFFDGTNNVLQSWDTTPASWAKLALHCTNTKYWRIKNIDTVARLLCYDGIQSK